MSAASIIPLLLKTAHTLRRRQEEVGDAHGITLQQFNVLSILAGAERQGDAELPVMEVSRRLVEPGAGITRFIRQLTAHGWVRAVPNPEDGRQQLLQLTPAGREKLTQLETPISDVLKKLVRGLDEEARGAVVTGLRTMLHNLK